MVKVGKIEFAEKLAEKMGVSKAEGKRTLDTVLDLISDDLKSGVGSEVQFQGFGTFVVKQTRGGEYRNPETGAKVHKEPRPQVKFKASPLLYGAI